MGEGKAGLLERLGVRKQDAGQLSLDERIREVGAAFRELLPKDDGYRAWVTEVYDDHVIVCHGEDYYSIPYAREEDSITFDLEATTEVERAWVETAKATVAKVDDDRRLVFGWAYVSEKDGHPQVDHSGEWVGKEDLEDAAYAYVLFSREADERHTDPVKGLVVESFVATPEKLEAMGLAKDAMPTGWWVGYHVADDDVWKGVKDGTYTSFSIGGLAARSRETIGA